VARARLEYKIKVYYFYFPFSLFHFTVKNVWAVSFPFFFVACAGQEVAFQPIRGFTKILFTQRWQEASFILDQGKRDSVKRC
jgi:hypothetical protein